MKCILLQQAIPSQLTSSNFGIQKLTLSSPPTKTSYLAGDSFDKAGLVIIGTYGVEEGSFENLTADVTDIVSVSPDPLTDGTTNVKFSVLTPSGREVFITYPIEVTHKAISLSVETPEQEYEYGDTFVTSLPAVVTYSDGETAEVTAVAATTTFNQVGPTQIEFKYIENGVTVSTMLTIDVKRKSVPKPTWKGVTLTYNTNQQSVNSDTYWNNYNTTYWIISDYTGQNAGEYTTKFNLNENYRWEDGSIEELGITWSIAKANRTITLTPSSINLDSNNQTGTAQASSLGTGAWSISPTSITGLTSLSIDENGLISVVADGATAVSASITVSRTEDENYNAASSQLGISASYFTWGDDIPNGDADWWAALKAALPNMNNEEKQALIGKEVSVTLSSAVLGTTTHKVRCIGVDQDGVNTATFQTSNCLDQTFFFSNNSNRWYNSIAKQECQNYYNAFSGKHFIKSVSKLICTTWANNRNGTASYSTETVWLPSESEMGLDSHSCCRNEGSAYSYYNSNNARSKKLGDNGNICTYWERSLAYVSSTAVCCVYGLGGAGSFTYNDRYSLAGLAPAFVIG